MSKTMEIGSDDQRTLGSWILARDYLLRFRDEKGTSRQQNEKNERGGAGDDSGEWEEPPILEGDIEDLTF